MAADTPTYSDSWSESGTSPSVSPSAALSAVPKLERSASATSSVTSASVISTNTQSFDHVVGKRRGFSRPQGTFFADSARNRDSVMSLGTIAHLQHYFARTGLLDGKGAQLAREDDQKKGSGSRSVSGPPTAPTTSDPTSNDLSIISGISQLDIPTYTAGEEPSFISSPDQISVDGVWNEPNAFILPPTVSTYKQKSTYVPPPPNLNVLRRELREALEDAKKLLKDVRADLAERATESAHNDETPSSPSRNESLQGWYEIQGLQVLDLTTLAIRAAKNFYTAHERPHRLYAIKSERQIRSDLFSTLDILKKTAARNFAGGMKFQEIDQISTWATSIEDLISRDEEAERREEEELRSSTWRSGDWTGREREREWLFLKSFDLDPESLPEWTRLSENAGELPTPFLASLRDGRRLVKLHNELVRKSRRPFEEIKTYHQDVAKPYRCADNLRFWIKAAELRWDCILKINVLGVVYGESVTAWKTFDDALMKWCCTVREEVTKEWEEHREAMKIERPIVRMELGQDNSNLSAVPW